MSQISVGHNVDHPAGVAEAVPPVRIDLAAVTCPPGFGRILSLGLIFAGAVLLIVLAFMAFGNPENAKKALAAYHVGFIACVALGLGSLGLTMILHQVNAGWSATVRRQFENVASVLPICALLFIPQVASIFLKRGALWHWMDPHLYDDRGQALDPLLAAKAPFLDLGFFGLRIVVYFAVWTILSQLLFRWSREQDRTGDRWLTARMRFHSAWGLLAFALTTAFAAFDWLMALDYHFFSTMFGVYFFAGAILSSVALCIIVLATLRANGKLGGLVTPEHFHDLGKLLLAFTVFWAYIAFSQYFLIWYSNIPEETAWFVTRRSTGANGWMTVGFLLVVGHFLAPFFLLLWRFTKRVPMVLAGVAAWQILLQLVDFFYIIRPTVTGTARDFGLIDVVGVLGPFCLFLGLVAMRVTANPLIVLRDPRLAEAVEHKNYV